MGRRGPSPEPTRLRVLKGETRPSQLNLQEPEPLPGDPIAPDDLSESAKVIWQRVMREFGHTGVIRAVDGDALRLYCEAMARYLRTSQLLDASGPIVKGHRGEMVKNPLHQLVRDNAQMVRAMAGELGLTPAARVGLRDQGDGRPARTKLQELREKRERRASRPA